ncbi:hypothetical protein D3C85_1401930 [compost metagenome]
MLSSRLGARHRIRGDKITFVSFYRAHHTDNRNAFGKVRGQVIPRGTEHWANQDTCRTVLAKGLHHFALLFDIFRGVGHHHDVARIGETALQCNGQLCKERIGEVVDHHPDHFRRAAAQVCGSAVVHVTELLRRLHDLPLGIGPEFRAVLQCQRHGGLGDSGRFGDISNGQVDSVHRYPR